MHKVLGCINKIYQKAHFDKFAQISHTHKNVALRYALSSEIKSSLSCFQQNTSEMMETTKNQHLLGPHNPQEW